MRVVFRRVCVGDSVSREDEDRGGFYKFMSEKDGVTIDGPRLGRPIFLPDEVLDKLVEFVLKGGSGEIMEYEEWT